MKRQRQDLDPAPRLPKTLAEIILETLVALPQASSGGSAVQRLGLLTATMAKRSGDAVLGRVFVHGVLACAKAKPSDVHVYACLVGVLSTDAATLPLATSVLVLALDSISNTCTAWSDRVLLLFVTLAWRACGLAMELILALLQQLASRPAAGNDHALTVRVGGAHEARALTCLHVLTGLNPASAEERADIVATIAGLPRVARLETDFAAAPDRRDPDHDRLALGLLALRAERPGNAAFEAMLGEVAGAHPPGSGAAPTNEPAAQALLSLLSRLDQTEDAFVASQTHLPLFPGGVAPNSVNAQPASPAARFQTRELICLLLDAHALQPAAAALALGALDCPHQVVETVFSQMLLCPAAAQTPVAFAHVLVELCKLQPQKFPEAVEDGLDRLMETDLDLELVSRLATWLVVHLTAFSLDWPWVKWDRFKACPARAKAFVTQVMQRLENVMPRADIEHVVPREILDETQELLRDVPRDEAVVAKIKSKPTTEELLEFLDNNYAQVDTLDRVHMVLTAALFLGAPSFTHTRLVLVRVAPALIELGKADAAGLCDLFANACFAQLPGAWAAFAMGVGVDNQILSRPAALKWLLSGDATWQRLRTAEDVLARPGEHISPAELSSSLFDADLNAKLWGKRRGLFAAD